jgi:hypothetical protein
MPMLEQQNEQIHRTPLQSDRTATAAQLVRRHVQFDITKAVGLTGIRHNRVAAMAALTNSSVPFDLHVQGNDRHSSDAVHGPWTRDEATISRVCLRPRNVFLTLANCQQGAT